ncbi:DUF5067 domain-containing protein [Lactobacillus gasseri]|uniref:DUF5067 domain-containing protein n=1 Tax=Lactobacillus gasseri TaxID=1596 RepID=UPI0029C41082|nr:DUF5067 domain-containing protein [Lactobacillus gasseri]MDX5065076.1 DUF5067 domain-containing protein [Lactobacillus gasseri]MDX5081779.1 DUF5067 domain-containing protein [Lactobacillus gasseri]
MKKRYIVAATTLVALGLGTSACSNQAGNGGNKQATSRNADKLEKTLNKADKEAKEKTKSRSTNKFIGNTFKTSKGSIKIEKLTKVTLKNATPDGDVHYIVIDASFTNKAKKGVTPEDFFMDNLKVEQKLSKSTHEVGGERSQFEDNLTPWKDKINAKLNKVDSGQTVPFAMSFQLDKDDGDKDVNTYILQPWNSDTMDSYGKPLKINVSSTQTITVPKDNDDSDIDNDD